MKKIENGIKTKLNTMKIVGDVDELTNGMTHDQLRAVYNLIVEKMKAVRALDSIRVKSTLAVGQMVEWTGRRGKKEGKVTKINRTKAIVMETSTWVCWSVPMSMLKVIE